MIKIEQDNIFNSKAQAIVNTVNTHGVMGKGLALQFKKRFPENFKAYEKACKNEEVQLGKMFVHYQNSLDNPQYIINFPTKGHWKSKSKLSDIVNGLEDLLSIIKEKNIQSIAIPPLGAGLGGLAWADVKECIEKAFADMPKIDVILYEPLESKNPNPVQSEKKITLLRAIILDNYRKYLSYAESIELTLLEAHKILYFLQTAGMPLKLRFEPYIYGPYAPNLAHVLNDMEGNYIQGFRDGTIKPFERLTILPQSEEEKEILRASESEFNYKEQSKKVQNFIEGYETPMALELLATVHWLINEENIKPEFNAIKNGIAHWGNNKENWGTRKLKFFTDDMINIAIKTNIELKDLLK